MRFTRGQCFMLALYVAVLLMLGGCRSDRLGCGGGDGTREDLGAPEDGVRVQSWTIVEMQHLARYEYWYVSHELIPAGGSVRRVGRLPEIAEIEPDLRASPILQRYELMCGGQVAVIELPSSLVDALVRRCRSWRKEFDVSWSSVVNAPANRDRLDALFVRGEQILVKATFAGAIKAEKSTQTVLMTVELPIGPVIPSGWSTRTTFLDMGHDPHDVDRCLDDLGRKQGSWVAAPKMKLR